MKTILLNSISILTLVLACFGCTSNVNKDNYTWSNGSSSDSLSVYDPKTDTVTVIAADTIKRKYKNQDSSLKDSLKIYKVGDTITIGKIKWTNGPVGSMRTQKSQ